MAVLDRVDGSGVVRTYDVQVDPTVSVRVIEKSASDHAPIALLVHGLGVGGRYWDLSGTGYSTMDHLVGMGLRACALDHRGYGGSTPVPGSTVRAAAATRDVVAVIDHLRAGQHSSGVCLVGHSWGGIVATIVAATHPESVESLVLLGMPYRRLHPVFQQRVALLRAACTDPDGWMPNPTHIGLEERLCAFEPEVLTAYEEMVGTEYPRIPIGVLDDCIELPHVEHVERLACPVLVVCGDAETVVDRSDMLNLLDDLPTPDKGLMFVGRAGHLTVLEKHAHVTVDRLVSDWALRRRAGGA